MKTKFLFLTLFYLFVITFSKIDRTEAQVEQDISNSSIKQIYKKISVSNSNLLSLENLGIDLTCGAILKDNKIELELSELELSELTNSGINYEVLVDNLEKFYSERAKRNLPQAQQELNAQKTLQQTNSDFGRSSTSSVVLDNIGQYNGCDEINWATPTNFKLGSMGGCFTLSEALAELDLMRSLYPNLISVKTDASPISQTTIEGRTTYYVRISDNPDIDEAGEPETLYTGMTHSREVASLMNLMYYMWYVLENYGSDTAITNMINNQALYFIPIVNSDGLAYNESVAPNGGGLQRKNRRETGACSTYSDGIDLNRNFGYYWGNGGSSTSGCSETYRGTNYFSEPESQIIRDFFLDHDFELVLNLHSYKNAMLHGFAGVDPAVLDANGVDRREDEFAKYNHEMTYYNRFAYGPSTQISALNSGNTNDWMMGPIVAGSTGGPGSGKHSMAWTPENGLLSQAAGSSGFWPDPLLIDDIARNALSYNFLAAYYSGKYAKLIDLTSSNISSLNGNIDFGIEFLGQTSSDFTLVVTPISSNITLTSPATLTGMVTLEQRKVSALFTLDAGTQANDAIEFKVSLSNDDGILYEANIIKYYSPTVLFEDDEETNGISNWTATGGSWGTTIDAYSGSVAITDSPSGSYGNSQSKALQLNNAISTTSLAQTVIQYYAKWDLERSFDYVQIEASTNGSTWMPLCGTYTKPGAPNANNSYSGKSTSDRNFQPDGEQLYDGDTQDKWVMEELVIDASNNSTFHNQANVYLRFNLNTDSTNRQDSYTTTFDGFVFDDFKIITNTTNIPQTITFNPIADKNTTDNPFQLSATATSGLPLNFSIVSGPASISGDTVTLTGVAGTVIVRASQSGDSTYNAAADVDQSFEVITPPCLDPPSGLGVSNITPSSATVSWNFVTDATYNYQYRTVGSSSWTTISTANNSELLTGLNPQTEYEVQVSSVCPNNSNSTYSNTINFTTNAINYCSSTSASNNREYISRVQLNTINNNSDPTLYSDFTGISTTLTKGSQYSISITPTWNGKSRREGYAVWIDYNYDGDFNDIGEQILSQSPTKSNLISASFTVPQNASEASFRMRVSMMYNGIPSSCESFSGGEVEDYTIIIEGTGPDVTPPSIPSNLVASNTTETTTDLSWNTSTDNLGVTGYDLYQNGGFITNVSTTSYQATGLTSNTSYSYYVIARDAALNSSGQSNTVNITTQDPPDTEAPSAPTSLAANNTTEFTTDLTWNTSTDNVGVTGYDIYQDSSFIVNVASTSYQVSGLSPSANYAFYVIARDAAGLSSVQSNTVNVTTNDFVDTEPPTGPTGLASSIITETTTDLTWNASTDNVGVTGYDIYQDNSFLLNISGTSYQVTGLTESTNYSFYVIARDVALNSSGQSNTVNVTTLTAPTCSDGFQNGDETGIDCGGSFCPVCPPSDTILSEGYFETGLDGWSLGGKDASRASTSFSFEGLYSIKLRDNSGVSSSMTSTSLNLSPYNQVEIDFYFYANSMENGEDVWLRYNDGSGWVTIATWVSGSSFNDNAFNNVTFTLNSGSFNLVNGGQFRIQCDASGKNDQVYIDQVVITGIGNGSARATSTKLSIPKLDNVRTEFTLYPNPVKGNVLNVSLSKYNRFAYAIKNLSGQVVVRGNSQGQVDISSLKTGVYFIEVNDGKDFMTKRFIRQ